MTGGGFFATLRMTGREMAKGRYSTSDIYEAAALIVYGAECKDILVDRSKDKPEALFLFDGSVGSNPSEYRAGKLLVEPRGYKTVMVKLRRQMFDVLDGRDNGHKKA